MGRPKKIIEPSEIIVKEVVENIDNKKKNPIMSVVYDTVEKKIVLISNDEITQRYKHI